MSIFCAWKWRWADSRRRRRPMSHRPWPHFFSSTVRSFAIDQRRNISPLPLQSHPRLWGIIKRIKTKKTTVAHEQWWKLHGIQKRLAELHGSVLVQRSFKPRNVSFRCSCVDFATQNNVHYEKSIGRKLVARALFGKLHGRRHFPHNKMAQKSLNSERRHLGSVERSQPERQLCSLLPYCLLTLASNFPTLCALRNFIFHLVLLFPQEKKISEKPAKTP